MKSCTLSQFSIETTGIGLSGRTVRLCLGFPGSRYSSVRTDGRVSDVCYWCRWAGNCIVRDGRAVSTRFGLWVGGCVFFCWCRGDRTA